MDWVEDIKSKNFPDSQTAEFWVQVADVIDPTNPSLHYGLLNEYLEGKTFLTDEKLSLNDLILAQKLTQCKDFNKLLTSKTRPFHITRWFCHILSLHPIPNFSHSRKYEKVNFRLVSALEKNDLKSLSIILDSVNINAVYPEMDFALPIHIAALKANKSAVDLLLSKGADLESQDKEGQTPIFYAVQSRSVSIFIYLKDLGANLRHIEKQGRTLLYWAASLGSLDIVKILIELGLDPNVPTKLGRTALSKSAWNGSAVMVGYLLSLENIKTDTKDKNGRTALHNAVWGSAGGREGVKKGVNSSDSPECAKLLIEKGCDIESEDKEGNTAFCIACSTYSPSSLDVLVLNKANMFHSNKRGLNGYHQALSRGIVKIAEYLTQKGMPVDPPSKKHGCLKICIKYHEIASVKWLLEKGVAIEEKDFEYAVKKGNIEIIKALLEKLELPKRAVKIALELGKKDAILYLVQIGQVFEDDLVEGLKKDKKIAEAILSKWEGKINSWVLEKMIEFKIDIKEFLPRAEVNGNVLRIAVRLRDLEGALRVLGCNSKLVQDCDVYSGNTALHIACISGFNDIIPKLIELAENPIEYILKPNKKLMTAITLSQMNKNGLSISEYLKSIVAQSSENKAFSQIKALKYSINLDPLTPHPYKSSMPISYPPVLEKIPFSQSTPFTWIDSPENLDKMLAKLISSPVVAIDLEYHLYESKKGCICLVQISNGAEDFLVDSLVNRKYLAGVLKQIVDCVDIVKVLHGADSDLIWLQNDFDLHPVRIFDTARAYKIINKENCLTSLEILLFRFFGLKVDKSFQVSEWRIRPLPEAMVEYARNDVHYLVEIYQRMREVMSENDLVELSLSCNVMCLKSPESKYIRIEVDE